MRWQFSLRAALLAMLVIAMSIVIYRYCFPPVGKAIPVSGVWGLRYFQAFGKHYDLDLSEERIQGSPIWDRHRDPHPPFSPNTALTLADQLRLRWIETGRLWPDGKSGGGWELQSVQLVPADDKHWFWLVSFEYMMDQSGPPNEFLVPVTMDGIAIEPKLLSEEPEETPYGNSPQSGEC